MCRGQQGQEIAGDEVSACVAKCQKETAGFSDSNGPFTCTFGFHGQLSTVEVPKPAITPSKERTCSFFLRSSYITEALSLIVRKLTPNHFKILKCWRKLNLVNWTYYWQNSSSLPIMFELVCFKETWFIAEQLQFVPRDDSRPRITWAESKRVIGKKRVVTFVDCHFSTHCSPSTPPSQELLISICKWLQDDIPGSCWHVWPKLSRSKHSMPQAAEICSRQHVHWTWSETLRMPVEMMR